MYSTGTLLQFKKDKKLCDVWELVIEELVKGNYEEYYRVRVLDADSYTKLGKRVFSKEFIESYFIPLTK